MILYLVIAIGICIYHMNSRSMTLGRSIITGLAWPVTFSLYLFSMITGRSVRNPLTGITDWSGRQGRGQGTGRGRGRRR